MMQQDRISSITRIMVSRQAMLWLTLNLLDLGLSIISLEYGARELPMMSWLLEKVPMTSHYIPISYVWYGLYKLGLAALVPPMLDYLKKPYLLKWLNIGLGGVSIYIVVMLVITFS